MDREASLLKFTAERVELLKEKLKVPTKVNRGQPLHPQEEIPTQWPNETEGETLRCSGRDFSCFSEEHSSVDAQNDLTINTLL